MNNTCYIGIDLGDKTLSINEIKSGINETPAEVRLPGQKGNEPIQSTVGFRENGEVILADGFEGGGLPARILSNFKRRPSAHPPKSQEMREFREGATVLLDTVLSNEATNRSIRDLSQNCDEIVFCVGYPTNWTERDRDLYEKIIRSSVLGKDKRKAEFAGKPMRLILERESTAAFVYMKRFGDKLIEMKKDDRILLLDFGSSTVNVTALTTDSRTTLYNSGHDFFGGRLLDCMIADYFIEMLPQGDRKLVEELDGTYNGIATKLLILEASSAKERLSDSHRTIISPPLNIKSVKLSRETLADIAARPLAPVIRKHRFIPDAECDQFGTMGWTEILREYLISEKNTLAQEGIAPNTVILTGGGSVLYAVQDICREIFGEIQMLDARESTKTISKGLALAAKRADQSIQFDRDVQAFIDGKLVKVVQNNVPSLAKSMSADIADYMCTKLVIPELLRWRNGSVATLDRATLNIKNTCSANSFSRELQNSSAVRKTVKNWSINTLGNAVAKELESLCIQHNVHNFRVEDLNVIKVPAIDVSGASVIPTTEMNFVANILAGITGIVAATLAPSLLVLIIEIIALIMPGLAAMIAGVIVAIPGGIVIVAGAAGVAAFQLMRNGWESVRNDVINGITKINIPDLFRKAVTENRIRASVMGNKSDIEDKIYRSMTSHGNVQSIAKQTSASIAGQVRAKMNEIRYILETR